MVLLQTKYILKPHHEMPQIPLTLYLLSKHFSVRQKAHAIDGIKARFFFGSGPLGKCYLKHMYEDQPISSCLAGYFVVEKHSFNLNYGLMKKADRLVKRQASWLVTETVERKP